MLATKQGSITREESKVLIKNMMRISVSSICYLRELFPDDTFKAKQYGVVEIHQLQGARKDENGTVIVENSEAFLLTQWLERGVFAALESEYLQSMIFAIYCKHPKSGEDMLVETYEFKVAYQSPDQPAKINDIDLSSKDAVKNQAAKFIRCLTEFTSTLETIPPNRWITLQLKYNDNTPPSYEPEFFTAATSSILSGVTLPLFVNIGQIKTPEMELKVKFAGLENLFFDDKLMDEATTLKSKNAMLQATDHTSSKVQPPPIVVENGKQVPSAPIPNTEKVEVDISEKIRQLNVTSNKVDDKTKQPNGDEEEEEEDEDDIKMKKFAMEQLPKIKSYIEQSKAAILSRCSFALKLDLEVVRIAFNQLFEDGFLLRRKDNRYSLNEDYKPKPKHDPREANKQPIVESNTNTVDPEMTCIENSHNITVDVAPTANKTKEIPTGPNIIPQSGEDDIAFSQSSVAGSGNLKKSRKYSIIKDPINLKAEHKRRKNA